jgi:hypothetical protein
MPEQQPHLPMCRHGATPVLHVQQVAIGTEPIETFLPGRTELIYNCPTPGECADKAMRYLIDAGIEPPEAK